MVELLRYTRDVAAEWDECVRSARQGTFLFERGYMDYHADRFVDHSLLVWRNGQVIAVLPAHERDGDWVSHGGLTFGGIVSGRHTRLVDMLEMTTAVVEYTREHNFRQWIYIPVPHIFHTSPAEDDVYALSLAGASLRSRSASLCINLNSPFGMPSRRMGGVKTAQSRGVTVEETGDLATFWDMLNERLRAAHNSRPVHTLDEMQLLQSRFPQNIRLYGAFQDSNMIAGLLMYENTRAARAQYIASNEIGRAVSAVDLIMYELLTRVYRNSRFAWLDLGISNRLEDNTINLGLYAQKEKIGGRTILIDAYSLDIASADLQRLRTHFT